MLLFLYKKNIPPLFQWKIVSLVSQDCIERVRRLWRNINDRIESFKSNKVNGLQYTRRTENVRKIQNHLELGTQIFYFAISNQKNINLIERIQLGKIIIYINFIWSLELYVTSELIVFSSWLSTQYSKWLFHIIPYQRLRKSKHKEISI